MTYSRRKRSFVLQLLLRTVLAGSAGVAGAQEYEITSLGTLGGSGSFGYAINDAGQVTGYSITTGLKTDAFLYSNGTMHDLGFASIGLALNAAGTVTGYTQFSGPGDPTSAFISNGAVTQDLGTLGGVNSFSMGVNAANQVAGYSTTADGVVHAFLYSNGTLQAIGSLQGSGLVGTSEALAINSSGQINGRVVSSRRPTSRWYSAADRRRATTPARVSLL